MGTHAVQGDLGSVVLDRRETGTVSEGTVPYGSTWAMNPLPRTDSAKDPNAMDAFPAPCYDPNAPFDGGHGGLCSGWYGPDNLEIVDALRVPAHLTPGKYV